ncbi:MAG TPA: hypothetical protein VMY39_09390 [Planctomycetota bacterium]|nr:hypothetical protein [Planctomycetota bacterium]HUV39815.1 hypothetical protein [Planctomycetota bacterium]
MDFPKSGIGGIEISRLVIGSNPFGGFSHFSAARDKWLKSYFTVERVCEVLEACTARGLNAFVSGCVPKFHEAMKMQEDRTGRKIHWFCTPGGGGWGAGETIEEEIDWASKHGVDYIMPHPCWTDLHIMPDRNEIDGFEEITKRVRGHGMIPGVSTHRAETIVVCDTRPYDVEVYIQIFNVAGFLMPLETDWMTRVVRNANRPVLCIKPLAAGRVLPPTGLRWTFENCKPVDVVACGFMSVEEANEDIDIVLEILTGKPREGELAVTRSKRSVMKLA